MKISVLQNDNPDEFALYTHLIMLLEEVKLVHGGEGLFYTLKRHKKLFDFLKEFQSRKLDHFEKVLDELENS